MSHTNTEEITTLKTNFFESSLEWNIEKFKEYSQCDIGSITSRKIKIEGTDVYWILHVHPNGYHSSSRYDNEDVQSSSSFDDDNFVSLSLQIRCENPSRDDCFRVEVKTDVSDRQMISPHDPHKVKPIDWIVEYENVDKREHIELYKEAFIRIHDLHKYMFDGTLNLMANVSMKTVEVVDHVQANINHQFH